MAAPDPKNEVPYFVIKVEDLPALSRLDATYPRPLRLEWINRGTDQKLRRTTVEMLLRTLLRGSTAPSIARLHHTSGLRVSFTTEQDRWQFATAFNHARARLQEVGTTVAAAIFSRPSIAERAVRELRDVGVPENAISAVWIADEQSSETIAEGHSSASVAGAVAGGGVAGTLLGIAVLAIPGIGPLAAAGAIAASAIPAVTTIGAMVGATGGAIARMLTDVDVDSRDALYYEEMILHGGVFVSVDCGPTDTLADTVREILHHCGGRSAPQA